ncbi:glycosyltransferase [Acetobacteraceae bacterium]|nr:glycosyltransferase [Acetobacteraceae bacterium]
MRYLFVHQSFPGQYLHYIKWLRARGHEVVFITSAPRSNFLPDVRRIQYVQPPPMKGLHSGVADLNQAALRAEAVAQAARSLKKLGYMPDIIIGHHGWGELLNLKDVFPDSPILGYFEFYYAAQGLDVGFDPEFLSHEALAGQVRLKNSVNLQALALEQYGQTPTLFQRNTYPPLFRKKIALVSEGVDLEKCKPDSEKMGSSWSFEETHIKKNVPLVTYISRNLEPYRGFHSFMRALPTILSQNAQCEVVIVGGNGVSYGALPPEGGGWKQRLLREIGGLIDIKRVHFIEYLPYKFFVTLLQRSWAHIYLTYPFVLSWSLREAMAIGCPIVASDTAPVKEFLTDSVNARLVPFLAPKEIADKVLELLEDREQAYGLGLAARREAEAKMEMNLCLNLYNELINKIARK